MNTNYSCFLLLVIGLATAGCFSAQKPVALPPENSDPEQSAPWFQEITRETGLDFVHDPGPTNTYFMPQTVGSGCAIFDFDGDGLLDIYLLQNAGPQSASVNRLYRQRDNGTFEDVTAGSGLGVAGYSMGVAIGDVNNDGKPDVLLTQFGSIKLFLNQGKGRFEDVSERAGLSNPLWATSAAFLDYDRDGWLDLVVVNYLDYHHSTECFTPQGLKEFCGPKSFLPVNSKLFRNRGPAKPQPGDLVPAITFEDVSLRAGLGRLPGPGLGVVCADFNGDGWPDIFITNDGDHNRLWINQHNGTFTNEAVSRGVAVTAMGKAFAGMGVALGDTNNKGRFDLFVTHLNSETNTLWRQDTPGQFLDRTNETHLSLARRRGTGFGTVLADFENKGSLDIAVVNGRILRGSEARGTDLGFWEPYADRNQLFANDGTGKYQDVSLANPAFCDYWNVARGLACADFDKDGGLDLLVTTIGGRARLFRNVAPNRGHWLTVRAVDPQYRRDAYGAEVRVQVKDRQWLRLVNPAGSYLCSNSPLAHFGLGSAREYDGIVVRWPDGVEERFPGGAADRQIELHKKTKHQP